MKNILVRIVITVLYPLYACYQIVAEAPVLCCDDELIGFGEFSSLSSTDGWNIDNTHVGNSSHSLSDIGWVCHAR